MRGEGVKTDFWVWCPYYQSLLGSERAYDGRREIVFYGAMRRRENWSAALWFLDEVFPSLEGDGYRFTVVGANPPEQLTSRVREGVTFTGFVDSVEPYFARALCLVAPLSMAPASRSRFSRRCPQGFPSSRTTSGSRAFPPRTASATFIARRLRTIQAQSRRLPITPAFATVSAAPRGA